MKSKSPSCKCCNSSISRTTKICTYCGDDIVQQRNFEIQYKSSVLALIAVVVFVLAIQLGLLDQLFALLTK